MKSVESLRGSHYLAFAAGFGLAVALPHLPSLVVSVKQILDKAGAAPPAGAAARTVPHEQLRAVCERVFKALGSSPQEQAEVAHHLVESNLMGHDSHGVQMLEMYVNSCREGRVRVNTPMRVLLGKEESSAFAVVDGMDADGIQGFGQVTAKQATALAISRAKRHGVALVTLRSAHHIGRLGAYGAQCTEQGCVAILSANVFGHPPMVAPHGGAEPRVSTNPLCMAVPSQTDPVILDFATSIVAYGKVIAAVNKGQDVAPGILLDEAGEPMTATKPMVMKDGGVVPLKGGGWGERDWTGPHGAILPFGGHKGGGLSFMCELLGGALTGGPTCHPKNPRIGKTTNSMTIIVIDPSKLMSGNTLKSEVTDVVKWIKSAQPLPDAHPYWDSIPGMAPHPKGVLAPGDAERYTKAERTANGVSVSHGVCASMRRAAALAGVPEAEIDALMPALPSSGAAVRTM